MEKNLKPLYNADGKSVLIEPMDEAGIAVWAKKGYFPDKPKPKKPKNAIPKPPPEDLVRKAAMFDTQDAPAEAQSLEDLTDAVDSESTA